MQWLKWWGPAGSAPCSGLGHLLLMKKCSFMHEMSQIPHPHRRLRPLSSTWPLVTTDLNKAPITNNRRRTEQWYIFSLYHSMSCLHTDRQTDRHNGHSIYRACIALCGKNLGKNIWTVNAHFQSNQPVDDLLSVSSSSRIFPASWAAAVVESSMVGSRRLRLQVGGCGRSEREVRGSRKNVTRPVGSWCGSRTRTNRGSRFS